MHLTPQAERVSIVVWNSAPPLSAAELGAAFAWGERGRANGTAVGGSGYGLHIVQGLIARMGGTVELANAPLPDELLGELPVHGEPPGGVSCTILLPRHG